MRLKNFKVLSFSATSFNRFVFRNSESAPDHVKAQKETMKDIRKHYGEVKKQINEELVKDSSKDVPKESLKTAYTPRKDLNILMKKKYGVGLAVKGDKVVIKSPHITKNGYVRVEVVHKRGFVKRGQSKYVVYRGLVKYSDLVPTQESASNALSEARKLRKHVKKAPSTTATEKPKTPKTTDIKVENQGDKNPSSTPSAPAPSEPKKMDAPSDLPSITPPQTPNRGIQKVEYKVRMPSVADSDTEKLQ